MNIPAVTDKRKKLSPRIEDTDNRYSLAEPDRKRRKTCHDGHESNSSNTVCPPNVPAVTHKRKTSARRTEDTDSRYSLAEPERKRRKMFHDGPQSNSSNTVCPLNAFRKGDTDSCSNTDDSPTEPCRKSSERTQSGSENNSTGVDCPQHVPVVSERRKTPESYSCSDSDDA
jgi:hypothetical protein